MVNCIVCGEPITGTPAREFRNGAECKSCHAEDIKAARKVKKKRKRRKT